MDFKFVTSVDAFFGKVLPVDISDNPLTFSSVKSKNWHPISKAEAEDDSGPGLFRGVLDFLREKNWNISKFWRMDYRDVNDLKNKFYCLEDEKNTKSFLLKVLNPDNKDTRELVVWSMLGYDPKDGKNKNKHIMGLPPLVKTFDRKSGVLMDYFPGVLKPVAGGMHELGLVLNVVLYLGDTLENLHRRGFLFMDLHPENILFSCAKGKPITFFVADMGGAKPICDSCDKLGGKPSKEEFLKWHDFADTAGLDIYRMRWTMDSVSPPISLKLFEDDLQCPVRVRPEYDHHTLARSALLLLGLPFSESNPEETQKTIKERFSENPRLEKTMAPTRNEMSRFFQILSPSLYQGKRIDFRKVHKLFESFFMDRAEFAGKRLGGDSAAKKWKDVLLDRFQLYGTAKDPDVPMAEKLVRKKTIMERIEKLTAPSGATGDLVQQAGLLNQAPESILRGEYDRAEAALLKVQDADLLTLSDYALYSYVFHRKILRILRRKRVKPKMRVSMMELSEEKKTKDTVIDNPNANLGLLVRRI